MSELSQLKEERAAIRKELIPLREAMDEARAAHQRAFNAYQKCKQRFDALERCIAELEAKVKVIPTGRSGKKTGNKNVDPLTAAKAALATLKSDEKEAFLRELGLLS